MPVRTAIVPAAGMGTRLLPLSAGVPKEMLPLGRKPVLHYIAEELGRAGIEKVTLVTSLAKQHILRYFQLDQELEASLQRDGRTEIANQLWSHSPHMGIDFDIVIQHQPRGLGDAVLCGQPDPLEPVVVALGDCVLGIEGKSNVLPQMLDVFQSHSADVVIAFEEVRIEEVPRFGIAQPKRFQESQQIFELDGVVEKPQPDNAPSQLAIAGRYVFSPEIFKELKYQHPGKDREIQLTDSIHSLITSGAKAYGVCLGPTDKRFDVGDMESFIEAFIRFACVDPGLREAVMRSVSDHLDRSTR